jgi:CyaY protein
MTTALDEREFDKLGADELRHIEDALGDIDPDECEISVSGGVLSLALRDGAKIVINTHRAAREIWMAAQAGERRAWHFGHDASDGRWRVGSGAQGEELRATLAGVMSARLGRRIDLA